MSSNDNFIESVRVPGKGWFFGYNTGHSKNIEVMRVTGLQSEAIPVEVRASVPHLLRLA